MRIGINSRIIEKAETGVPRYVRSLYKALDRHYKEHEYIFFQTKDTKIVGKTIMCAPLFSKISSTLFDYFFIIPYVGKEKLDIFHGPAHHLPYFKKKNTKYVLTIHDLVFKALPHYYSRFFRVIHNFFIRRSITQADAIVAVSEHTKKDIIKFYNVSPEKISVIYHGIDPVFFTEQHSPALLTTPYILSVTTNPWRKNIFLSLEAFSKSSLLNTHIYVIAGDITESHKQELVTCAAKLDITERVTIIPYMPEHDLINLYRHASFLIYPSFYEGFGFPVLEAMACGCPIIASNTSSLTEIVRDDRWLVNPYDVSSITLAMNTMMGLTPQDRETLIEKNKTFAHTFTWQKTADQMNDIFKQLLKK